MRVSIFGSRSIYDERAYLFIEQTIKEIEKYASVTAIVTAQEPKGVCKIAQTYAKRNSIKLELHFLNNKKWGTGMYHARSNAILENSDLCILIHDGISQGTFNEWELCEKKNKKHIYEQMSPTKDEYSRIEQVSIINKN